MRTDELREKYLEFFVSKGHTRCDSDVLVPTWDPTVLFTPAGMNPFKDHFLGKVKLEFTRAASCQKCLRTGDIDNVGRTAYHHTFFEMLGNFSFGDYFKREAIAWAWEFLTGKKWLGLDPQRLTVTVYLDDDEAADIWHTEVGLATSRIERLGEDDNFWPAGAPTQGPDGVCGPCSEIFYHPEGGEAVEVWNLVFTQFNRVGEPPENLRPLPSRNIDTGMGLERMAACLQGVTTNYHIDILRPLVEAAGDACGRNYDPTSDDGRRLRRIADHIRACTFAIHENVYPGSNKEKYVIRRLLRRAVLDGRQMGLDQAFLHQLVPKVAELMSTPYPELAETTERVAQVVRREEENFFSTIDAGLDRIRRLFETMQAESRSMVSGEEAAEMYTTYGFPAELLETLAVEQNLAFDWPGFREAMAQHGEVSGKIADGVMGDRGPLDAIKRAMHAVEFLGYTTTEAEAELRFIIARGHLVDHLREAAHDEEILLVLDRSPFYGEAGGQVGDRGEIVGENFRFQVTDTQREGQLIIHHGHLAEGEMKTGSPVTARVNSARRNAIRRAHSATHILHYVLQSQLGKHAQQQGSKVDDDWLRFDFSHMAPVSGDELASLEAEVRKHVAAGEPVRAALLPLAEARKSGAMMLFGEKYPDPVRVVSMGEFSKELCGGTHLENTAEVGDFEIIAEESVQAGTRRVVALTGPKASEHIAATRQSLQEAADRLGVPIGAVPAAVRMLVQQTRELKKQLSSGGPPASAPDTVSLPSVPELDYAGIKSSLRDSARALNVAPFQVPQRLAALQSELAQLEEQAKQLAASGTLSAEALLKTAEVIGGVRVVVAEAAGANPNLLRQLIDQIRKKAAPAAILLAAVQGEGKVLLVAGLTRDLVEIGQSAGSWVRDVAAVVGGSGGGKPDLAQAGGKLPEKLPEALEKAREVARTMFSGGA